MASGFHVALVECVKAKGVATTDTIRRVIPDAVDDRRFGLWMMSNAKTWGYVEPWSAEKQAAVESQSDPLAAQPSQQQIDAGAACHKDDPTVALLARQPTSGPWQAALDDAEQRAEDSPEWSAAVADWSACLESKGVTADPQMMAPQEVDWKAVGDRTIRPQDIELAVIDVTCKEQNSTVQRLADAVAAAQAPVIAKYRSELMAQRAELDAQVAEARKVLSDAGL